MIRTLPDPIEEPTIKVARAAAIVGVSLRKGYLAVEAGEWPAVRTGRAVRVLTKKFLDTVGLSEGVESQ